MWHHPDHMFGGMAKAAKSSKTPKHLIPHLERHSMLKVKGKPITGAKPQNTPKAVMKTNTTRTSALAESQVKAPPEPFRNPKGVTKSVASKKAGGGFFGGR
jgi:hypothetical protein